MNFIWVDKFYLRVFHNLFVFIWFFFEFKQFIWIWLFPDLGNYQNAPGPTGLNQVKVARVRSTDRATPLTLSLSFLSLDLELSGDKNRLRLRRAALANSGRLHHRAVGQTPP